MGHGRAGARRAGTVVVLAVTLAGAGLPAGAAAGPAQDVAGAIRVTPLPSLGGPSSTIYDLNNRGEAAGGTVTADGAGRPALWSGTQVVDLAPPGGPDEGEALAVNDRGRAVGYLVAPGTASPHVWLFGRRPVDLTEQVPGLRNPLEADINDRGQVLLHDLSPSTDLVPRSVVWEDGRHTWSPEVSEGSYLAGQDINERGVVAGTGVVEPPQGTRAFTWRPGRDPVDLGHLGGHSMQASAINDRGDVVGIGRDGEGRLRSWRWRDGRLVDLGSLGGATTTVPTELHGTESIVNERGDVVGQSVTADGHIHAFLWRDGRMTDLGTLGGSVSNALAINERGQVIGQSTLPNGEVHLYLWQDGRMTDLSALVGPGLYGPVDINDRGQVVGLRLASEGWTAYRWDT